MPVSASLASSIAPDSNFTGIHGYHWCICVNVAPLLQELEELRDTDPRTLDA
jgi:hypothetical protein